MKIEQPLRKNSQRNNATKQYEPHERPPFLHVVDHRRLIDEQRAGCKTNPEPQIFTDWHGCRHPANPELRTPNPILSEKGGACGARYRTFSKATGLPHRELQTRSHRSLLSIQNSAPVFSCYSRDIQDSWSEQCLVG